MRPVAKLSDRPRAATNGLCYHCRTRKRRITVRSKDRQWVRRKVWVCLCNRLNAAIRRAKAEG